MKTSRTQLYALVSFMTLVWGLNYIAAKIVLRSFPALLVAPLRAALAAVMLLPVYYLSQRTRKSNDHWEPRELATIAILGVFGITLNQMLFVMGMGRTSVAHAALLIATNPLIVLVLAALRGQERLTARKLGGVATAIAGIAVLQFGPGRTLHGATPLGDLLVFLGTFTFSLYTVFGKEVTARHDSVTVNTFGYIAGALAGAPILVYHMRGFDFARVSTESWWALAFMAVLSSVVCYLIFYYALNHMPASRVAAFSYVQPVIASVAGLVMLNEPITAAIATGGLLVLSGVWITGRS